MEQETMPETEMKQCHQIKAHFRSYLNDESNLISNGFAEKIFFPRKASDLVHIIKNAVENGIQTTISGGGTGVSGGRVPQGGWVIATDKLTTLSTRGTLWEDNETGNSYEVKLKTKSSFANLTVPAGMPLRCIEKFATQNGWFYPPDPTEKGAFIGGNIATNASGSRSFKFGSTRNWVKALKIVLPSGELIGLSRDDEPLTDSHFKLPVIEESLQIPTYRLPTCRKNVAGPVLRQGDHALDLFIGTEGSFGIVVEATLKLIKPPEKILNIFIFCSSFKQALKIAEIARSLKDQDKLPVPLSVEFIDKNSLKCIQSNYKNVPKDAACAIILEQGASDSNLDVVIEYWNQVFHKLDISDQSVAQTRSEIKNHKKLRHSVPETINRMCIENGQSKLGTDYCVPIIYTQDVFKMAFALGVEFEEFQAKSQEKHKKPKNKAEKFGYAIWAHIGDSHIHLNFIPRTKQETIFAKKLMVKFMKWVVKVGGSVAAEHGLGKKKFQGVSPLYYQYGKQGIEEIRKLKHILDPHFLLNRGNLVDMPDVEVKGDRFEEK